MRCNLDANGVRIFVGTKRPVDDIVGWFEDLARLERHTSQAALHRFYWSIRIWKRVYEISIRTEWSCKMEDWRLLGSHGSHVNEEEFTESNAGIVAHCSARKSVHWGHGWVLHSCDSSPGPLQFFPPLAGLKRSHNNSFFKRSNLRLVLLVPNHFGLLHFRVRNRTPMLHVLEHVFQSDHSLQLPFRGFLATGPTIFFRFPIGSQNPLMHHCIRHRNLTKIETASKLYRLAWYKPCLYRRECLLMEDLSWFCTTEGSTCDRTTNVCMDHSTQRIGRGSTYENKSRFTFCKFWNRVVTIPFTKFHSALLVETVAELDGRMHQSVVLRTRLVLQTLPVAAMYVNNLRFS